MRRGTSIIVGLLARAVLLPFFSHPFDVYLWHKMFVSILQNVAAVESFPPMIWYVFLPFAYVYEWLYKFCHTEVTPVAALPKDLSLPLSAWGVQYVPDMPFIVIVKIPFVVSDILLAVVVYLLVKETTTDPKHADLALKLWFLNPFVIWISSGWGLFDTLPTLFAMASLLELHRKRVRRSAIYLAVSVGFKLFAILFLIPILLYFLKTRSHARHICIQYAATFTLASLVIFLPAARWVPHFVRLFLYASEYPGVPVSVGRGLTYWSFALAYEVDATAASVVSMLLVFISVAMVYAMASKTSSAESTLWLMPVCLSSLATVFLTYRVINEQYFVWIVPLLAVLVARKHVSRVFFYALTIVAMAYSLANCVAPFCMLPLSAWIPDFLVLLLRMVQPWRIRTSEPSDPRYLPAPVFGSLLLAALGTSFSILLAVLVWRLLFKQRVERSQGSPS